jgi:hypothetical protein
MPSLILELLPFVNFKLYFFLKKKIKGNVTVILALMLPSANLYVDHNFLNSWCIVFILGHNNPWDNTF